MTPGLRRTIDTNVIVVGLGPAGSVVAEQLALAGVRVIALEKGDHHSDAELASKFDELRHRVRGAYLPRMDTDPITWRPSTRTSARVLPWASDPAYSVSQTVQHPPASGVGGGTLHWGGNAPRARAADFRMRTAILERFGQSSLPENTEIVDWPISYDDLEPYYDRAEWELGVSGSPGNLSGELLDGGNVLEAPRRRGYPMPPLERSPVDRRFADAARRLGYNPFPIPAAVASVPWKGRTPCTYCGWCAGYTCHTTARTTMGVTTIPNALKTGNLDLRPRSRVFRLLFDSVDKRVTGVSYFDADGQVVDLYADAVVLAAYALENARLMLASGLDGNGNVGKYYMTHNYGRLVGVLPENVAPFSGSAVAFSALDDANGELVPDNDSGVIWGAQIMSSAGDKQPITGASAIPPSLRPWGQEYKDWLRENFMRTLGMCTMASTLPSRKWFCDLDPYTRDRYGQPVLRITHDWENHDLNLVNLTTRIGGDIAEEIGMTDWWSASPDKAPHVTTHDVGVHRMGEDPRTSVVNSFGKAHGHEGLYAIGGGQFPTLPGCAPTLTILAMAYRSAEQILLDIQGGGQ